MTLHTLTELQYSTERKGPFALYIYDENGYHTGKQWFRAKPLYAGEEITTGQAHNLAFAAVAKGLEVRACDGGDMLVFHAKDGKVLYPADAAAFWEEIAR